MRRRGLGSRYVVREAEDGPAIVSTPIRRKAIVAGCDWSVRENREGFVVEDRQLRIFVAFPNPAWRPPATC